MELKDFTEKEQKEVREGLSTAEISDKEAADKILALVPEEWIKKIPFFVRKHATRGAAGKGEGGTSPYHYGYFSREDEQA